MSSLEVSEAIFGKTARGKLVHQVTITNSNGVTVQVLTYGGIIRSLHVPDRDGIHTDIVLGYDNLAQYEEGNHFFGALIGRCTNRISSSRFVLDRKTYVLEANEGANHLHGGSRGFGKVVWEIRRLVKLETRVGVVLQHTSLGGEGGYPGRLDTSVSYILDDDNVLRVEYYAESSAATPVSLTQHSYFNLAGSGSIRDHLLQIDADHFTSTDAEQIPTGELRTVNNTPLDFRILTPIGARIEDEDEQLKIGQGYDHTFVLNDNVGRQSAEISDQSFAAKVSDVLTGRTLSIFTTEPCIQFYSGNKLEGERGKNSIIHPKQSGFCLETQQFPNAINQPRFPMKIVAPGDPFQSRTMFAFGVE